MSFNITDALLELKPGSMWVLNGNNYSNLEWLDKTETKPTEDEVNAKIVELEAAEPMKLLRVERNKLIAETDWRASSDLTLSNAWKTYRQALRDLPNLHHKLLFYFKIPFNMFDIIKCTRYICITTNIIFPIT